MRSRFLLLLLLLLPLPGLAREYPAEIIRVIDGDTFVADVDLGLGVGLKLQRVRLAVVDAPERGTASGEAARTFARVTLSGKKVVLLTTGSEFDKYHRILARVVIDGKDFAALLRAAGFVVP